MFIFTGKIDAGWHVYSTGLPSGGPTSAALTTEKAEGAQPMGKLTPRGKEINVFDKVFEMKLRYFEHSVSFVQKYKITGKTYKISRLYGIWRMQRRNVYATFFSRV